MKISIVVAISDNGVIGKNGQLPWYLSADLQHFKAITLGKPVIMGRKTYESIGRPLPDRENIILTRDRRLKIQDCTIINDLDQIYLHCKKSSELMIIGGVQLYTKMLPIAQRLLLTEVHANISGDTYFPAFDRRQWTEIERQDFKADAKNQYDYSFVILEHITDKQ